MPCQTKYSKYVSPPHYLIGHQSSVVSPKGVFLVPFYLYHLKTIFKNEFFFIRRRHKASLSIVFSSLPPRVAKCLINGNQNLIPQNAK